MGVPGTGRAGGRRARLLHPLAPGKYREVGSTGVLVGKPRAPVVQDRQDKRCSAAASSLKPAEPRHLPRPRLGISRTVKPGFAVVTVPHTRIKQKLVAARTEV